jgi:hypothetical protein
MSLSKKELDRIDIREHDNGARDMCGAAHSRACKLIRKPVAALL